MSYPLRDLKGLSDEQLEAAHDQQAKNTSVGVSYYLDELRRREMIAAMHSSTGLARRAFWLTVASTLLSAVATVAAVLALVLR